MMVVVPAFTPSQQRNPETVLGGVSGQEALRSPHVCSGIYQPGKMQAHYRAEKIPQSMTDQPPKTSKPMPSTVIGTQCHLLMNVWNLSLRRSGI